FHTGFLMPVHVDAAVIDPGLPPTAVLTPNPLVLECSNPAPITLDASGSADPESAGPLNFEWDFDLAGGDPLNFTVDAGPTGSATIAHAFTTPPTATHVAVRVTDAGALSTIAVVPLIFKPIDLLAPVTVSPFTAGQIQLFNGNIDSASANLVTGAGYVFLGVEAHNGSGATAGASAKMRFFRTQDGVTWTPLTTLMATNPYGEIWWDYAIGVDLNGNVYGSYTVQDGPSYSGDFNHVLAVCPNFGTGAWSVANQDTSVFGQPNRHFVYNDPTNANNVIDYLCYNNGPRMWRSSNGSAGPWTLTAPFGGNPNDARIFRKPSGDLVIPYIDASGKNIRTQLSTNGGGSWTIVGSTPLDPSQFWIGGCPAMNPVDLTGNTMAFVYKLYIGAGTSGEAGIHCAKTTNGGATWSIVNTNVSTNITYEPGDPGLIRATYDAGGGLYATYFQALWPPQGDCRGFVAYSPNDGTTFNSDFLVYDTNPQPSWPGMQIATMPDGCGVITAFSEFQVIKSRTM
ncbi:MAG: hypothetical protein ABI743_15050, partial [bacterium]